MGNSTPPILDKRGNKKHGNALVKTKEECKMCSNLRNKLTI